VVQLFRDNVAHMAKSAHLYNNVLAFASTGVDTGFSDGAEDEKWVYNVVEHCMSLRGRTYHDLRNGQDYAEQETNGVYSQYRWY
jgi:CO dehydrogenase/acetyl-CoA synthase alpha subunit